ncbi:DUF308 domain-containing protein [Methanofollis ethanolicus]|uniref:DUF308 domain-containing protein n=1 Tax=Methanofollis ethanolicus TaxID=488124 RepID=UPI0008349727|nr:DUF308 domain-containing protein [Methanofollis ethanolicus]
MAALDDFLGPLHSGVWEVEVPKFSVTEPLGPAWIQSAINVPTPGTIASYRKGRYHVHETSTEWKVHLDRYDPAVHPLMHLVDDAPLVFMIAATFVALVDTVRRTDAADTRAVLEEQTTAWQMLVLFGLAGMTAGASVVLRPIVAFSAIIHILLPLALLVLGVLIAGKGMGSGPVRIVSGRRLLAGAVVAFIGAISYALPVRVWGVTIFVLIGIWGLGSAVATFKRVSRGRTAVPEGLYTWCAVGGLSLLLALLIVVTPVASVALLTIVLGAITFLAGLTLVVNGLRLRERTRRR